ncbi:hypothetical protein [Herbidospora cretacea]|nr:hypothetical protein [Herbidospora cretacea]
MIDRALAAFAAWSAWRAATPVKAPEGNDGRQLVPAQHPWTRLTE